MTLDQTIDLISQSKHTPCSQFIDMVNQLVQNIDGNLDDCVVALLTSDKHIMWVEFMDGGFTGSRSKYVG
jgi:hypothetical protein